MILSEIMERLEAFCPASFAQSWDNVGLQTGRTASDISTVCLCVDVTSAVIDEARHHGAQLLVTHHPLLFTGTKRVTDQDYVGKRILELARGDIACFSLHTNFDVLHMADAAADDLRLRNRRVLEVTFEDDLSREGLGRIGDLPEHMTLRECAVYVRDTFRIPNVRVFGDPDQPVVCAAILPGSGSDEIDISLKEGADVMITGDISHHKGIDAVEKGIAVIDAGHYGIEKIFVPYMRDFLRREFPDLTVIEAKESEPFITV